MEISDYWISSGIPGYLVRIMENHKINMPKLIGRPYASRYFMEYRADVDNLLVILYQSGYLTLKGYDKHYREYWLDYPNDEIRQGFMTILANSNVPEINKEL